MSARPPFIDPATGTLDTAQLITEAIPLAKLVGVVAAIALVPFTLVFTIFGSSILGAIVTVIAQFVLAVGTGIVLMYVIARGIQLSGE